MNFWIWIRNPSETKKPAAAQRLLALLRAGVKDARLLCPVSYAVFLELMKQLPERRLAQARIMDELSQGIGIRNRFDTAEIEYLQFFARQLPLQNGAKIDPVWAPVGHLIGEKYRHFARLSGYQRRREATLGTSCGSRCSGQNVQWVVDSGGTIAAGAVGCADFTSPSKRAPVSMYQPQPRSASLDPARIHPLKTAKTLFFLHCFSTLTLFFLKSFAFLTEYSPFPTI